ncbi:MAG TPA: hypothetical protein VHG08_02275 [Longimicrobium sp.]|nr:hypothetical protein [Longimicrobium sp.]
MMRSKSRIWLAGMLLVSGLGGFALEGPAGVGRLEAQSGCGMFNGNLCNTQCNRECTNGSCCDTSYYYYSQPVDHE